MGSCRSFCSRREAMVIFGRGASWPEKADPPIEVMLIVPPVPLRRGRIEPVQHLRGCWGYCSGIVPQLPEVLTTQQIHVFQLLRGLAANVQRVNHLRR